ncbi:hypothetical protein [Rhodopila sp.]|uniref:hypothetical protein n=1 Tax=Rhodopila sp. TaxID=2480087 RepID=UPI003D11B613
MSASRGNVFGSRRLLLAMVLGGAGHQASAQVAVKMSPRDAKYQDTPHGGMSCQACSFFRRSESCQIVAGDVSPFGWCRLFDMPD